MYMYMYILWTLNWQLLPFAIRATHTVKMIALLLLSAFILSASFPLISFALSLLLALLSILYLQFPSVSVHNVHLCAAMKTKPTLSSLFFKSSVLIYKFNFCITPTPLVFAMQFHSNFLIYLLSLRSKNDYTLRCYILSYHLFKKK